MIKILFLPNWKVHQLAYDNADIQAPDKQVRGRPYWFFRYFKEAAEVSIIDFQQKNFLSWIEKKANTYIWQGIKAFFQDASYDVVISHGAQSGLMYSFLRTLFFRKNKIHIIFDIGSMNGARQSKVENLIIQWMLKSNPYIICHSKVIIENYKSSYTNLVNRSLYIPFGVDVDDFKTQTPTEKSNYILSFGASKRDYATLIEAWSGIKTPLKLRLIGYQKSTEIENVEVIGKVSIAELRTQIANALFVVIPLPVFNYSYGQMTFLQSMSMGKAVIVTQTPSSIDYIQDGVGALFVRPYDVADMREKIETLLNQSALLESLSKQARPYVMTHFSEQIMAEKIEQYIHHILNSSKNKSTDKT